MKTEIKKQEENKEDIIDEKEETTEENTEEDNDLDELKSEISELKQLIVEMKKSQDAPIRKGISESPKEKSDLYDIEPTTANLIATLKGFEIPREARK